MPNPPDEPQTRTESFMALFLASERRIYAFILSLVGNFTDADDVMQDAVRVMWQKFDQYEPGTNFSGWAMAIARYEALTHRRSNTTRATWLKVKTLESIADRIVSRPESPDIRREVLRRCLSKLPERSRRLVEMRYEPGANIPRIAQKLGQSVPAIYKALLRVRGTLTQCVRRTMEAEGLR